MSFLKRLGQVLLRITQIATGFAPIIQTQFPQSTGVVNVVTSDLAQIGGIITSVEAAGQALQLTGVQKLTGATPLVAQAILQSSLLAGHKIADPALFQKGSQEIAQGVVDLLNSLHADGVKVEEKKA